MPKRALRTPGTDGRNRRTAHQGGWADYAKRNSYPKIVRPSRTSEQDADRRGLQFPNDLVLPTLKHALEDGLARSLSASPALVPIAGLAEVAGIGGEATVEAGVLLPAAAHRRMA
jgi:hypothetical protein